jgi:hypothetical protein
MEEQRITAQNSYSDVNYKLDNQALESSKWNNKLTSQLNSTHEKIDKFIGEELRRDTPTGSLNINLNSFNYSTFNCIINKYK